MTARRSTRAVRLTAAGVCALMLVLATGIVVVREGAKPTPPPPQSPAAIVRGLPGLAGGLPVTMASYQRQLAYAIAGYTGPGSPGLSPAGQTVLRLLEDSAIQQAIGEGVIDYTARQRHVSVSAADVTAQVALITAQAGGPRALGVRMASANMTSADLQAVARHELLRERLAAVLHDPAWLDHVVAKATIVYYVSDGAASPDDVPAVSLGHPAPPFVAVDSTGRVVSLADLRGKVVVLSIWATWCGRCGSDLQLLEQLATAHPELRVVALDYLEAQPTVTDYVKKERLSRLSVWRDTTGGAYANYLLTDLPATFFIDRNGIMRSYNYGPLAGGQTLLDQARHALEGLDNTYYNLGR
jgi:cytochrome c biogenesis protein CcmG/thiol:disulfide interchange protein DsbE